jgi:hypothetical protein
VFPVFGVFTTGRGRSCFRLLRKVGDFSIGRMGNFQPVLTVEGPAIGYPRRTPVSPGRISPVQVLPSQCPQGKSCWKVAPAYRKQPGWPAMLAWYFALRRRTSLNIVERLTGPAFQMKTSPAFEVIATARSGAQIMPATRQKLITISARQKRFFARLLQQPQQVVFTGRLAMRGYNFRKRPTSVDPSMTNAALMRTRWGCRCPPFRITVHAEVAGGRRRSPGDPRFGLRL